MLPSVTEVLSGYQTVSKLELQSLGIRASLTVTLRLSRRALKLIEPSHFFLNPAGV